jgi:hypothetical protein
VATACSAQAQAQSVDPQAQAARLDRNVGVLDRRRPDYDAVGISIGSFILLPKVTVTADLNDNIYAGSQVKANDTVLLIQPEATLRSDWSRNMVEATIRAAFDNYTSHSSENTNVYDFHVGGRYDIADASNLNGGILLAHSMEPRYLTTTTQNVRHPVEFDLTAGNIGAAEIFNRIRFIEAVQVQTFQYQNAVTVGGAPVLEKDRDRTEWVETGAVEFAYTPDTTVFLRGDLNQRNYRLQPSAGGLNRDATGYVLEGGVRLDLSHLLRGELRAGYLHESYSSSAFRDVDGLALHGKFDFFPTELTTVTATADRAVGDAADPRASSYLTTSGGLEVDHELRRNIILSARANLAHDEYKGIDRKDDRLAVRIGGSYLINRSVGLTLYYNHIDVSSSGIDHINAYKVNELLLSVVLQR